MSSLEHSAEALRQANGRIQAFTRKFKRGHLYLAYHAAFPLALNPDMVYRIWANFQHDEWGQLLQIPWIAVADLLLSNLCEEVGHELYQMDLAVRDTLLGELVANPGLGQPRLRQLARFLEDYVEAEMKGTDAYEQRLAQSQKWVAQAYQGRETAVAAAQSIAATLKQNEQSPLEVARLSSLVQQIRQPLQEAGFKNLVQYGQVAWTLVHGDEDGRSRIAASNIVTSGAQVGDVVLMPPPHVTPPPISATTTESDELDVVETMRVEGPTSVSPNELFKLVVTVPNVGQMDWTADYFLLVSGEGIEPMEYLLPSTPAGTAATLTVELAAAEADGRYRLQLQVQNSQGDLLEKATAFDFRVVTRRGKQAIEDEEAYRFIFEGGQGFENDFSVAEAELQDLTMALKGSLRRIAWGDAEPFGSGKAYRYGDGRMDEERLRVDLGQLALQGMRAHDAIFPQIEGGINALDMKFGWDLMVGMSQPGVVQIASRTGRRLLIPAALFYDYPLDDGRRLAEYRLCDVFVTAVRRGQPLQETVCFQGDCPAYDDDEEITICPSGFWGFRHSLGMPLVSSSLTDASMTIQHEGDPQIAMSVATDAGFRYRQQHEAALRSMGLLRGEYADSREATIELMKQSVAEVVYFFCFGGLEEDGTPFMRVGSPDEGAITAMTLLAEDVYWEGKRPFIFMNGVDTTAFASEHALDLVRTFTDASGAAGVMGIEITVFEQLAVAFAEAFLQHFMVEGRTAGEAIRAARLALLQQGNPLGLVYTLYALPDLRLEQVFAPIEEPLEELAPRFVEPFDFRERIERKLAAGPADEGALVAIDAWRQNPEGERFFLVTGEEGSGKGELVAQLAQQDWVGAVHFFLADDEWTMNWDGLYKSLAAQLGNRYEDYGRSLQEVVQEQERRQQITQKAVPSEVLTSLGEEGIQLELDPTTLLIDFDVYIRKPLAQMWLANSAANVVMVLDGWDVAAVGAPEENVAELLAAMSELPLNVRWVMTLRPLPEMLDVIRPLGMLEYRLSPLETVESNYDMGVLLNEIRRYFDFRELQEVAFNLNIDLEEVPNTRNAWSRELLKMLDRQGRLGDLMTILQQIRSHVDWVRLKTEAIIREYQWQFNSQHDRTQLLDQISNGFDLDELKDLAFYLDVDDEETLQGRRKSAKIRDLIDEMEFQGRLRELVLLLRKERPDRDWVELDLKIGEPIYNLFSLHRKIEEQFDLDSFQDLVFELEIDYEELPGSIKSNKLRGLIIMLIQQERLDELMIMLQQARPNINWRELGRIVGWASAAFLLIAESGDVAQVGEFGINLRTEPARTAVVLGRVNAGSQVTVLGEASGEYVPVAVLQSDLVAGESVSESAEDGLSWEVATEPLYRLMAESFDLEEFYTLCFELSLDYEDLAGQTKSSKALELQRTMMRTGRVSELLAALTRVRPYLNLRPYLFMILVENYRSDQDVERLFRGFGLPVRDFPEPERFAWGSEAWREEKLKGLQQWVVENGRLPELVQRVQAKGADLSFYELPEPTTVEAESQPVVDSTDFRTIAYDPKLFVNRETKFRGFRKLLEPRTRQQMMLIEAEKDMGKSWLLRHMQNHCRQEQIPVALIDLSEEDLENTVVLVERMIRQLDEENFSQLQTFMQELGLAEGQVDLSRVASSEKERRDLVWRVSGLFFEELERLAGRTAVALLFDSYENSPEAVGRWLTDELVARLSQSDLSHVIVIITGRRIPELDFAKHIVVQTGLELFTEEHVKEYLFDRRQLMDIDLRTVYLTSKGLPGLLAKMADAASVAINHPDDTDIYEALLAEISEDAATVVNMAANDGVDDFFATLEETQSASVEAEQASPTDEPWPVVPWPRACPIIAIHSYHGGVGKTQIAVNLGAVLAQSGLRVGIMETNLQAPRMHQVFGITGNKFWLNDYLWGQCDIKETVADVSGQAQIVQENGRLFVISANSEPAHIARVLREGYDVGVLNDGMSDFIESLTLDVLLAESQSGIQEETLLSLAICDAALIVLRANRQEMSATESLLEIIRKLDVPQVIFAVNQLPASTNAQQFKAEVEEEFGLPVVGLLPLTDDLLVTQSEGLFVVNQPHNPWSRSLKQMTVSLGNMLSASS